ncbi:His Kinase A (phospho-acceptor) domain-containing protein [Loktanella atrilutea]|uniref:histidine kinase n=2 Tax=Loktanella atrilutea TaxID=366533 RepID=A0A1M5FYL2_LOKAT|nr:His Kinase A (phospho-acceptor) domain-containing protein [Loktanella atrilutea]
MTFLAAKDDDFRLDLSPVKSPDIEFPDALRMAVASIDCLTREHGVVNRKRQALKLEALGQMACGVVHDFNNLLSVILGNSEQLIESLTNDKQRQLASATFSAAERAAGLSGQLLSFARTQPLKRNPVDVDDLINSFCAVLKCAVSTMVEIRRDLGRARLLGSGAFLGLLPRPRGIHAQNLPGRLGASPQRFLRHPGNSRDGTVSPAATAPYSVPVRGFA